MGGLELDLDALAQTSEYRMDTEDQGINKLRFLRRDSYLIEKTMVE